MKELWPPVKSPFTLAVLCSGGVDSAVLLGEAVRAYPAVTPIYVRTGLIWEDIEQQYLDRYLRAVRAPGLKPLVTFDQPVRDLYPSHWSLNGVGVPAAGSQDEEAYLPGRNLILFVKPLLWCLANGVPELATAPLAANPFPDATAEFYDTMASLAGRAAYGNVKILRPFAGLTKADVLRRGVDLPLNDTFSCLRPLRRMHCGVCNKCGERQAGFRAAGINDPTQYANS